MTLSIVPDEDKTPADGKTTIEMVLEKLVEIGHDARLAVAEAREAKGHAIATYNLLIEQNQRLNGFEQRLRVVEQVERAKLWPAIVALAALVVAVFALLRTVK